MQSHSTKTILKSLNLLYAEDNDTLRQATTKTLQVIFGNVFEAKDGVEALEIFTNNPVDIVLLDYVMPNVDGYELAKEIRKTNKQIPILICSGFTDKEKLLNAIELDIVKFIEKPIKYDTLMQSLELAIQGLVGNNKFLIAMGRNVIYDYLNKHLKYCDSIVELSKNEVKLIELLTTHESKLVTHKQIMEYVLEDESDVNAVRNIIYRLKQKIKNDTSIIAVKDFGYMFVSNQIAIS